MKEILDQEIKESKIQVIYKVDIIIFLLACGLAPYKSDNISDS